MRVYTNFIFDDETLNVKLFAPPFFSSHLTVKK
jgi:hypothetical protein